MYGGSARLVIGVMVFGFILISAHPQVQYPRSPD